MPRLEPVARVLHVIPSVHARHGGPSAALRELIQLMAGTEINCSLAIGAAYEDEQADRATYLKLTTSVESFPRQWPYLAGYSSRFTSEIAELVRAVDIVHVHSMWNWPGYVAALCAKRAGVPVIFRPAGALDRFDVQKHALLKRMLGPLVLKNLFQPPNVFHCTARREAEQLVTYGGKAERVVLHLPVPAVPGIDHTTRSAARKRLGIPPDAPVVLFMSRLNYKKGLELLLPSLASVKRSIPDLHFVLAGTGEPEIESLVNRLMVSHGMSGWTHRVGFVTGADKSAMFAVGDVFALPSQNENFGVSVVEALSAGLPVLVSPEVYIVNEIGLSRAVVVSERSLSAITQALVKLIDLGVRERAAIGSEARRLWATHFAPEVLRPRYIEFYQRVINRAIHP